MSVALNLLIIDPSLTNNIKNGFKKTGIFPFDAYTVDYTKIVERLAASTAIDAPTAYLEQSLSNVTLSVFFHIIFIVSCVDSGIFEQFKIADDHLG